jgi:hypothetical protein
MVLTVGACAGTVIIILFPTYFVLSILAFTLSTVLSLVVAYGHYFNTKSRRDGEKSHRET